jgi:hypothetical protein
MKGLPYEGDWLIELGSYYGFRYWIGLSMTISVFISVLMLS